MQHLNCKPGQWVTENRSWCSPKYAPRLLNTAHVLQGLGTTLLSTRVLLQILFLNSTNESRFISLSLLLEAGGCPTHRDACTHTHTYTNTIFSHFFQFKWFAITVTPSFISKIVSTLLMCACTFFLSASQQHLWFIAAIKVIINSFTILTNTGLPVIYEANSLQGWAAEQGRIKMVLIDKLTG